MNIEKQQLYDATALVFEHEEDFIKTFASSFNHGEVDTIEGFWMSGTNCLVRVYYSEHFDDSTVFIQTEDFLDWLEGKS